MKKKDQIKVEAPTRDFWYTKHDKRLFWIAGYTADGNTSIVTDQVKSLMENAQYFADLTGCKIEEVRTYYVNSSPRYKYMRVFYIETETPHPAAYVLDFYNHGGIHYHTMDSVLTT